MQMQNDDERVVSQNKGHNNDPPPISMIASFIHPFVILLHRSRACGHQNLEPEQIQLMHN